MLLGIDIGTSSTKVILVNNALEVISTKRKEYTIEIPNLNYAEQDPNTWWNSVCECIKAIPNKDCISAIGLSGQMHGIVAINRDGNPIRQAIIWSDNRSVEQTKKIQVINSDPTNFIANGFLLPSLLWIRENEPNLFKQIYKVMLPKDYIRYKLTGLIGTDHSDACATGAYSFERKDWNDELIEKLGLNVSIFPEINQSMDVAGMIVSDIAKELDLGGSTVVVYGGSDHSMQLIGNGIFSEGMINCNIGTGSQISITTNDFEYEVSKQLNIFSHAIENKYNMVGTSLNGGIVLQWLNNLYDRDISYEQMDLFAQKVNVGSDGLRFLPYINGERNLDQDKNIRGICYGLSTHHSKQHLFRAAMEGMILSLRIKLEEIWALGLSFNRVIASGGGAKSSLLLQMQADIFNSEIYVCKTEEQAALGAAIIAGLATSVIDSLQTVLRLFEDKMVVVASPIIQNVELYNEVYQDFINLKNKLL
ncbi:xylulokinase [Neobacillus sp. FSL H8-0543]|uniref:xylulokinase n=1 Tax=Neobacillus sp. FSL H8-0543 TaxID=2954672 RepID=UPI0031595F7A